MKTSIKHIISKTRGSQDGVKGSCLAKLIRAKELAGSRNFEKGKSKQQKNKMTSLRLIPLPSCTSNFQWKLDAQKQVRAKSVSCTNNCEARSFFLNPSDERILKKALKEPVAFMGGMFAGVLRLDLNEDPLKEWVTRTVEASGIITDEEEEFGHESNMTPQPQQIEID